MERDVEDDTWDIESKMTAEKVATSGICGKMPEVQRVCKDGGETAPTTHVDVIELACAGIEARRKRATMLSRQADFETELVEIWAVRRTVSGQVQLLKSEQNR